jgi:hypothetical protein
MKSRRSTIVSLILLLAMTLAMFGDLLFAGGTRVLGHPGSDMFLQYFAWREFGFRELVKGNLVLWNPHIFSGAPYFGGMQGALLYPPNWLFLVLSTPVAINWSVALHVFAIGAFMFFWMKQRGLSAAASFFAGHLPQLSAMTWSPLIFCSIRIDYGCIHAIVASCCPSRERSDKLQIAAGKLYLAGGAAPGRSPSFTRRVRA